MHAVVYFSKPFFLLWAAKYFLVFFSKNNRMFAARRFGRCVAFALSRRVPRICFSSSEFLSITLYIDIQSDIFWAAVSLHDFHSEQSSVVTPVSSIRSFSMHAENKLVLFLIQPRTAPGMIKDRVHGLSMADWADRE